MILSNSILRSDEMQNKKQKKIINFDEKVMKEFYDQSQHIPQSAWGDPRTSNFYKMYPEICDYFTERADGPFTRYYELKARHRRRSYRMINESAIAKFVLSTFATSQITAFFMERFWRAMRTHSYHVGVTFTEIMDEIIYHTSENTVRKILKAGISFGYYGEQTSSYKKSVSKFFPTPVLIKFTMDFNRAEFLYYKANEMESLSKELYDRLDEKPDAGNSNIELNPLAPPF